MKLTEQIYLASPYTKKRKDGSIDEKAQLERYNKVTEVAGRLEDIFPYAFILPITMSHNTAKYMKKKNGEFAAWARRDFTYIANSQQLWVVTMEGWDLSVGVLEEIRFAKGRGMPIYYIDPDTLAKTKRPQYAIDS